MVEAEYLQKQCILSRNEMAFYYFRDLFECFDHFRIFVGFGEGYAYESTYIESKSLRLYE